MQPYHTVSLIFGSRVNTHSLGGSIWFLELGYPEQRLLDWGRKGLPSWVPGSQGPREHHGACTKVDPCAVSACLCWETDHGITAALGYQQSCAWPPTESRPATGGFQCLGQQREWLEDVQIPFCLPVPLRQQHGNAGFLALRRLQFPAAGRASHWGRLQTGSLGPRLVAPVCLFFSLLSPVLHPSMLINLEFAAWERRDFRLDKRVRSNLIKPAVTPFGGNSSFRIIVLRFLLQSL